MGYNLPEIEKVHIEENLNNHTYNLERDRLKTRYFLYASFPIVNYYGLSLLDAKAFIYADMVARYNRYIGKNVLFTVGYDMVSLEVLEAAMKQQKQVHNFLENGYLPYQKQINLLDIGYDDIRNIFLNSEEYTTYLDKFFYYLFDKGLVNRSYSVIVYDNRHVFHSNQYHIENGVCYDNSGNELVYNNRQNFTLNIKDYQKEIAEEINNLNLDKDDLNEVKKYLGFRSDLVISLRTTNDEIIDLVLNNPEYYFGISFILINPKYINISCYIDDPSVLTEYFEDSDKIIYTGVEAIDYISGNNIPIFISNEYDEAVHVGIPSNSSKDKNFAIKNDLNISPVIGFIGTEEVLINSRFLNGYSLEEAKEVMTEKFINSKNARFVESIETDNLVLSSPYRFGIPIPLNNNLSKTIIPVTYDALHDVKMSGSELAEKSLVADFFNPDFIKAVLINAIRLKETIGIVDFNDELAKSMTSRFKDINLAVFRDNDFALEISWQAIINVLWRNFSSELGINTKNIKVFHKIYDKKNNLISRSNNNLVSIDEVISNYGSTTLRTYFVSNGFDTNMFDIYALEDTFINDVGAITDTFDYPILDNVTELDDSYHLLLEEVNKSLEVLDFKSFYQAIHNFIKAVYLVKAISKRQAKDLLMFISIIAPSLAEEIRIKKLNLKNPLLFYDWPE